MGKHTALLHPERSEVGVGIKADGQLFFSALVLLPRLVPWNQKLLVFCTPLIQRKAMIEYLLGSTLPNGRHT